MHAFHIGDSPNVHQCPVGLLTWVHHGLHLHEVCEPAADLGCQQAVLPSPLTGAACYKVKVQQALMPCPHFPCHHR